MFKTLVRISTAASEAGDPIIGTGSPSGGAEMDRLCPDVTSAAPPAIRQVEQGDPPRYTQTMLPIEAVQRALKEEQLDGWLLYDFHGSNPIASRLTGMAASGKMATRR